MSTAAAHTDKNVSFGQASERIASMSRVAGIDVNENVRRHYEQRTRPSAACDATQCALSSGGATHPSTSWGPAYWRVLYTTAAHYPHRPTRCERVAQEHLLLALISAMPCARCRANFVRHAELEGYALYAPTRIFQTRSALCNFVYRLHRRTTHALGRPWKHGGQRQTVQHHAIA